MENLSPPFDSVSVRITLQGAECPVDILGVFSTTSYLSCSLPNSFNFSLPAVVQLIIDTVADSRALPILSFQRSLAASILQASENNRLEMPFVTMRNELYLIQGSVNVFTGPTDITSNLVYFQILHPGEVYSRVDDLSLILALNPKCICNSDFQASCSEFSSSDFSLTNVTIIISTWETFIASGVIKISNCPSLFCGQGGRGLFLDLIFSTRSGVKFRQDNILGVLPPYSHFAVSAQPSIIPAGLPYSIVVTIKRFYPLRINFNLSCEIWDNSGNFHFCLVLRILPQQDGMNLDASLNVGPLPIGLLSGRIFSPKAGFRETTLSLFNVSSVAYSRKTPYVAWISCSLGVRNSGISVQAKLIGFPPINSISDVISVYF